MCHWLTFYLLFGHFQLWSHVFGTASDLSGLDRSDNAAAADDVEDEYETLRRQRSQKRAHIAAQRSPSVEI